MATATATALAMGVAQAMGSATVSFMDQTKVQGAAQATSLAFVLETLMVTAMDTEMA